MDHGAVSQQQLTDAELETAIDACKWIAALGPDQLERVEAFKAVFQLRSEQLAQEAACRS